MSLGLTKDSYLNLSELAREKEAGFANKTHGVERRDDVASASEGMELNVHVGASETDVQSTSHQKKQQLLQHHDESSVDSLNIEVEGGNDFGGDPAFRGFDYDYSDYTNYNEYDFFADQPQGEKDSMWCCLFPMWFKSNSVKPVEEDARKELVEKTAKGNDIPKMPTRSEDDEYSVGSEILGEKLSDKDQKAVLARLRLAQPDSANGGAPSSPVEDNGITSSDGEEKKDSEGLTSNELPRPSVRGILKKSKSTKISAVKASLASTPTTDSAGHAQKRRMLFPVYEKESQKKVHNNVNFAGMARVITVRSINEMGEKERANVWWQKSDYEDFRKTARMITKAILQPGSEIWLSTCPSMTQTKRKSVADEEEHSASDKWWHRFGHSRRGLEHIASMEEGRERQANCQTAVKAIVEEQRKMIRSHGKVDDEKLRNVAIQHTSWARDLALAAGSSDADAVSRGFDRNRKTREFYLLKMSRKNPNQKRYEQMPSFMIPLVGAKTAPVKLDVKRSLPQTKNPPLAQLSNKRAELLQKKAAAAAAAAAEKANSTLEPIHDSGENSTKESLSKRAAGFSHVGAEKVSMSTVLSGMGTVSSSATTVAG